MDIKKITTNKIQTKHIQTQKQQQKLISSNTKQEDSQKLLINYKKNVKSRCT